MGEFNRYSFLIGLSSVVLPCAVYYLVQQFFFKPAANKPTITNEPTSTAAKDNTKSVKNAKKEKKEKKGNSGVQKVPNVPDKSKEEKKVTILYGTCTGTARTFAEKLCKRIDSCTKYVVEVKDLKDYNDEKLDKENIVLFICSTWSEGTAPESARPFFEWLKDLAQDFRVSKDHLAKVKFAVFGLGGDIYAEHFAKAVSIFRADNVFYRF